MQQHITLENKPVTPIKRSRKAIDDDTREFRNKVRNKQRADPLAKEIRNGILRAKRAWDRGLFGHLNLSTVKDIPCRKGRAVLWMSPCCYFSVCGKVKNGYEIRQVWTMWCSLVSVWGEDGIVCVPVQLVAEGHCAKLPDPGHPLTCAQCDAPTWNNSKCATCGAPLLYWPVKA